MADRLYIGVDLGLDGALVALYPSGPAIVPMPTLKSGKGGRTLYDVPELRRRFHEWRSSGAFAIAEHLHAMQFEKGGSNANFQRGRALGLLEGLLVALAIPYELVAPQTWQKVMHAGTSGDDTKQRSIVAAQRLFPGVDLRRTPKCRIAHDGIADALLLAEYARRRHGAAPFSLPSAGQLAGAQPSLPL